MIASHDTFTYDKPINLLFNLFSIFWRCQKLDITSQYNKGVRIFDIRVARHKDKWVAAHGIYKSKHISFKSIFNICQYIKNEFPDTMVRIYLETNVNNKNYEIKDLFLKEAEEAWDKYKSMIWEMGTHFPWVVYFRNTDFNPLIKEYYCHLFNWNPDKSISYNLNNFDWTSWNIKLYAKKHNPIITEEMINDSTTIHFIDYIGKYPKTKGTA